MRPVDDRLGFSTFVGHEMNALPGLLQSVHTHFDEIVVVCTNCLPDDGTWDYLRELERTWFPLLRPYRLAVPMHPGHFDFGYMRSTAAHLNSCGYVAMLDADERVSDEHLVKLREVHSMALVNEVQVLAFRRHNWHDGPFEREKENKAVWPDWQPRMIRNNGAIWWRRPVHEITLYGPTEVYHDMVGCGDVVIHHHHDWFRRDPGIAERKIDMYKRLAAADPEWGPTYNLDMLPADEPRRREIRRLYRALLDRDAKSEEIQTWAGSTKNIDEMQAEIMESQEYENVQKAKENQDDKS